MDRVNQLKLIPLFLYLFVFLSSQNDRGRTGRSSMFGLRSWKSFYGCNGPVQMP